MIRGITEASATRKPKDAVDTKLWVDNSELVHAHFARATCASKARRGKSGKFADFLGAHACVGPDLHASAELFAILVVGHADDVSGYHSRV